MSTIQTRYAKSADVHIAYQGVGEGQVDLVMVNGWVTNLELMWEDLVAPSELPGRPPYFARLEREGASPGAVIALIRRVAEIDVRAVLPSIQVPTLIIRSLTRRAGGRVVRGCWREPPVPVG